MNPAKTAPGTAAIAQDGHDTMPGTRLHRRSQAPVDVVRELVDGLTRSPRLISPKFFYDSRGAALFDRITEQPEYYPTRVERQILVERGDTIARAAGTDRVLIEPGSGSSQKIELLLDQLRPAAYVPLEITESHLLEASQRLTGRFPWLRIEAMCADYSTGMELPDELPAEPRLVFFPGSTIGNFEPPAARAFLQGLRRLAGAHGRLLIGVDLRKDPAVLNAAYNDAAGITAQFNLNVLRHVNRVAGADFDPRAFRHIAFFNESAGRIEMHLESTREQAVAIDGRVLRLQAGERIHTENSYKYSLAEFTALALSAGFRPGHVWCDPARWFSVHLLEVCPVA